MKYLISRKFFELGIHNYFEKYSKYRKELLSQAENSPALMAEYKKIGFIGYMDMLIFKTICEDHKAKKWLACFWIKRGMVSLWIEFIKKQPDQKENLQAFDDWIVHKYKIKKEAQYGSSPHGNG